MSKTDREAAIERWPSARRPLRQAEPQPSIREVCLIGLGRGGEGPSEPLPPAGCRVEWAGRPYTVVACQEARGGSYAHLALDGPEAASGPAGCPALALGQTA